MLLGVVFGTARRVGRAAELVSLRVVCCSLSCYQRQSILSHAVRCEMNEE